MSIPTLVMIHGLIGSLDYFNPRARISNADILGVDLLGYGRERHSPVERLTIADQAARVLTRIEEFSTGPLWVLGHSMGGMIAWHVADRCRDRVVGLINVEGNFTSRDAFWSSKIAESPAAEWELEYDGFSADVPGWLRRCGIMPSAQRLQWAEQILSNQAAGTVWHMSRAIIEETGRGEYIEAVRRVLNRRVSLHLIAGEKSASGWDIPDVVRNAARSSHTQSGTGHLMMLEEPDAFCRIVSSLLAGE